MARVGGRKSAGFVTDKQKTICVMDGCMHALVTECKSRIGGSLDGFGIV